MPSMVNRPAFTRKAGEALVANSYGKQQASAPVASPKPSAPTSAPRPAMTKPVVAQPASTTQGTPAGSGQAQAQGGSAQQTSTGASSTAPASSTSSFAPSTISGQYAMAGSNQLQMLADRYGKNETIANQIVGAQVDTALGLSQTGQALAYNDAMNDSTTRMISTLRKDDFGYNSQLLAQQADISSRLSDQGNRATIDRVRTEGQEERLNKQEDTSQLLRARADARGQIARTGSRFFG